MTEVWRTIPAFPAYSASSWGRIRRDALIFGGGGSIRVPSGVLKERPLPLGHRQVTLSIENRPTTQLVHRLVAMTFLPQPAQGQDCVCHRDDDPSNNRPENLFWGSRSDNMADMVAKGRQRIGAGVQGSKLTETDIRSIRSLLANGFKQRQVAEIYAISQSNVSSIALGRSWGHVK
jgi:hypothetical protein